MPGKIKKNKNLYSWKSESAGQNSENIGNWYHPDKLWLVHLDSTEVKLVGQNVKHFSDFVKKKKIILFSPGFYSAMFIDRTSTVSHT